MKKPAYPACIIAMIGIFVSISFTQGVPAPYTPRLQTVFTGLSRPVLLRHAGDGSKRIFIVQQSGIIKVIQPGSKTPTNFIDLSSKIVIPGSAGDERGLLGLTFHPQYASNGKFYVNYTRVSDGATVVAEYLRSPVNPNQGLLGSERILFTVPQPFTNHNGGMVEFGPDGYLYIGMGDGGSFNDPGARAQNRSQLLGKMLRIDVDIPVGSPVAYLIPATNPFTGAGTSRCDTGSATGGNTCQEIWTIGMRNPWRWSFDRGGSHQMWVGDVGQDAIEEFDIISAGGLNYGWRVYEGNQCTGLDSGLCNPANFVFPIFTYAHSGGRCSITGGYVYRGTQGSLPNGAYTYADYCTAEIWMWNNNAQVLLKDQPSPFQVVSFGEDEDGEIYVCYPQGGQIDKIVRASASADMDGDLKTDLSIYRPATGNWFTFNSSNGSVRVSQWGSGSDIPAPEDYDGDNITDIAVFRPSVGTWFVFRSSDATASVVNWGSDGDLPVAGDYDGDSKSDYAVWRPSTGQWWIFRSSDAQFTATTWGAAGDKLTPGDFDGDGKADIAVWRPADGTWYVVYSSNNAVATAQWGAANDLAVPADFDGDGTSDLAVYRPSNGTWYIYRSFTGTSQIVQWGSGQDTPAVGDYDSDGKDDVAVYRPSNGGWFVIRSTNGQTIVANWGGPDDIPIPPLDTP